MTKIRSNSSERESDRLKFPTAASSSDTAGNTGDNQLFDIFRKTPKPTSISSEFAGKSSANTSDSSMTKSKTKTTKPSISLSLASLAITAPESMASTSKGLNDQVNKSAVQPQHTTETFSQLTANSSGFDGEIFANDSDSSSKSTSNSSDVMHSQSVSIKLPEIPTVPAADTAPDDRQAIFMEIFNKYPNFNNYKLIEQLGIGDEKKAAILFDILRCEWVGRHLDLQQPTNEEIENIVASFDINK